MRILITGFLFTLFNLQTLGGLKISGAPTALPPAHSMFGWAVTLHGEFAAVSAPNESYNDLMLAGAVYVYRITDGNWKFFQKILPADPSNMKLFGSALKLNGLTLLVGAPNDGGKTGSAYVFQFNGTSWEQTQKIVPINPVPFQLFGATVDLGYNYALISTISKDDQGVASGSIYQYKVTSDNWIPEKVIVSPEKNENDLFGACISIVSADHFLVGAPRANGQIANGGAIYSYTKTDGNWGVNQKIAPSNGRTDGFFGSAGSFSGDRLLVGAMQESADSIKSGTAYLYHLDETGKWSFEQQLFPENQRNNDYFGISVLLNGEIAIIGSPKWDNGEFNSDMGSADLFYLTEGQWKLSGKIIPEDGAPDDHFGMAMATDKNKLVIGSRFDDNPHFNNGSVQFFDLRLLIPESARNSLPKTIALLSNYPNPFRQATTIYYDLPVKTQVSISIFDLMGMKITDLVNREEEAGYNQVIWNGHNAKGQVVPSGIYIYQMNTPSFSSSGKMLLVK